MEITNCDQCHKYSKGVWFLRICSNLRAYRISEKKIVFIVINSIKDTRLGLMQTWTPGYSIDGSRCLRAVSTHCVYVTLIYIEYQTIPII